VCPRRCETVHLPDDADDDEGADNDDVASVEAAGASAAATDEAAVETAAATLDESEAGAPSVNVSAGGVSVCSTGAADLVLSVATTGR